MPLPNRTDDDGDRLGFDENKNYVSAFLGKLVPQWLARRAIAVTVEPDKRTYVQGEPIQLAITFKNRLPVPVAVETPKRRLWGWTVDGELAASDEQVYNPDKPSVFSFRPREVKRIHREWAGRFKRTTGDRVRWEQAPPKSYEIRAFVASGPYQAADTATIEITRTP